MSYRFAYNYYSGNPETKNSECQKIADDEEFRLIREMICCIVSEYNYYRKALNMNYDENELNTGMRAWGFSYKTVAFVWIKQNRKSDSLFWGMGHWTRANAEFCMLATKGRPKRRSAGVHQVILSHIEEHSKKPDEARRRIVELMGDLPRIELFARQKTDGWDVWGNEVACDIALTGGEPNVG